MHPWMRPLYLNQYGARLVYWEKLNENFHTGFKKYACSNQATGTHCMAISRSIGGPKYSTYMVGKEHSLLERPAHRPNGPGPSTRQKIEYIGQARLLDKKSSKRRMRPICSTENYDLGRNAYLVSPTISQSLCWHAFWFSSNSP